MICLKTIIHDEEDLVFVSDRAFSIATALLECYSLAHHRICIFHIFYCKLQLNCQNIIHYRIRIFHFEKNVQEKYKSSTLISLVVEAAYAYTKEDFDYYFHEIQKSDTEVPEYLLKANIKKWSRAYAHPNCYYIITSNLAETINSMLKLSTRD